MSWLKDGKTPSRNGRAALQVEGAAGAKAEGKVEICLVQDTAWWARQVLGKRVMRGRSQKEGGQTKAGAAEAPGLSVGGEEPLRVSQQEGRDQGWATLSLWTESCQQRHLRRLWH